MSSIEAELKDFLRPFLQLKLAILFGSLADGNANPASDMDLALLADSPINTDLKFELMQALGAKFGRPVDIVDLYFGAEPVLGEVLKGKRLLGDNSTYANLMTRHLLNTADFAPLQQRILSERLDRWIN
jgi:predicted nucleotidyltransferase